MKKAISRFCFLGGSTKEECSSVGWSMDCPEAALVGYYPEIFPPGHEAPEDRDIVVVDLPLADGGEDRVFCVYFRKRISRRFWNVLCFAYSTRDWILQERLACLGLTPDQWYGVAMRLKETDTALPLPAVSATPVEWDGEGMYVENYPLYDGTLLTTIRREGDWKDLLELYPKPVAAPAALHNERRVPLKRAVKHACRKIGKQISRNRVQFIVALLLALGTYFIVKQLRARAATERQQIELPQAAEPASSPRNASK